MSRLRIATVGTVLASIIADIERMLVAAHGRAQPIGAHRAQPERQMAMGRL